MLRKIIEKTRLPKLTTWKSIKPKDHIWILGAPWDFKRVETIHKALVVQKY